MVTLSQQVSFTGGEFSPSLYSRVDLQKYATGLRRCKNMIPLQTGGVYNRPGTKYIAETKYHDKKSRLVSFEFSIDQAYEIEFGNLYCRFYREGGQILKSSADAWLTATDYVIGDYVTESGIKYYCLVDHTSGTFATDLAANKWVSQSIYEIPTPYLEADLSNLKFAQSADVLYICHPDHAPMQLERYGYDDWQLVLYEFINGPFRLSNTDLTNTMELAAVTGTTTMTAINDTFDSDHVGSLWRIEHDVEGQTLSLSYDTPTTSASIKCGGTWRVISHGTWTGTFKIEKSTDNSTWTNLRTYSSKDDFNVNTYGEEDDDDPFYIRINCTACTVTPPAKLGITLSSDPFTQTGVVEITSLTSAKIANVKVIRDVAATAATANWAEGAWSDYRGWPRCITFFQDRLVFASSTSEPQTIWFSCAGDYVNFKRSTPLLDTDGITITLAARKMNSINNLVALSNLLALTSASEWTIGSEAALTPSAITAKIEGYRGCSELITPIIIGNKIIYVQRMGSIVRDLGYDFGVNGFTGDILNIYSSHLLEKNSIIDMAYQEEPDNLVWFVRDDGVLLSLTYLREQDVVAWAQHDTDGLVESIATIPGDGYHETWMIVKRGSKRFVERMEPRSTSTDPRLQYFLDCGISYESYQSIESVTKANPCQITITGHTLNNNDVIDIYEVEGMTELNESRFIVANKTANTFTLKTLDGVAVDSTAYTTYLSGGKVYVATDTIYGLAHLEGRTITALADGSVVSDLVVTGGGITLPFPASIAHMGLPYTSEIETLAVEMQTSEGTIQGRNVSIPQVVFRFKNSVGGFVGVDEENLDELIQRTDEAYGAPTRLYTQDYKVSLNGGYVSNGKVFYRQSDPRPVEILAVIPAVVVGG